MIETLITLPPGLTAYFTKFGNEREKYFRRFGAEAQRVHLSCDPPPLRLGSGGGTVHSIWSAWRSSTKGLQLEEWVERSQKVVLHSGGESRRLPAYASVGKAFLPLPSLNRNQRFDLNLADLQLPLYRQILSEAGRHSAVLIASGDVLLDFSVNQIPEAQGDIVGLGMPVAPSVASHFGVFFVDNKAKRIGREQPIQIFRQKPSVKIICRSSRQSLALVDTGVWLLSARAIGCLFARCGWSNRTQTFNTENGLPLPLDLYGEVGASLGKKHTTTALLRRAGFPKLTHAVVAIDKGNFFHLGSSRQLLESFSAMRPKAVIKTFSEGCGEEIPSRLSRGNIVTGLPRESSVKVLLPEQCIDVSPIGSRHFVLRPYHLDDTLGGKLEEALICGIKAEKWMSARGIRGVKHLEVFNQKIYPLVAGTEISQEMIDWFFANEPTPKISAVWRKAKKLSAKEIPEAVNFSRYFRQRQLVHQAHLQSSFEVLLHSAQREILDQDLQAIAEFCRDSGASLLSWFRRNGKKLLLTTTDPASNARLHLLLALLAKKLNERERLAERAFDRVRDAVVSRARRTKTRPRMGVDFLQTIRASSPARIDLAGGWTDTPPYCFSNGGHVINAAVSLDGAMPVEVWIRRLASPEFILRSVDQRVAETIKTYSQLNGHHDPKGIFSLHKAALALCGFSSVFYPDERFPTLKKRLTHFGGGLEIESHSRVPKGSGLGTSSILAATLLGALHRACHFKTSRQKIFQQVLAIEQLLTTGGGWQDQAGGIFAGLKSLRTASGVGQILRTENLSSVLVSPANEGGVCLLYYTGITRLAKVILKDIVQGFTLGRSSTLNTMKAIRDNAEWMKQALRDSDANTFQRCLARSWRLNRELDAGTSTNEIDALISACGSDLAACKLLGAGGGGYLLICAIDREAVESIRRILTKTALGTTAGFASFSIAKEGLSVRVVKSPQAAPRALKQPVRARNHVK